MMCNPKLNSFFSMPTGQTIPITWCNILWWIYKTFIEDKRRYQRKKRALSVYRLWCIAKPNLKRPVFIIGTSRSGTTFLGQCIGKLPEVSYHFEPIITKAAVGYIYEGIWGARKARWLYCTIYKWLMRLHCDADLCLVIKDQRNSLIIPFLHSLFPDARFIHIIRDGRDVALSWSKKPWLQSAQAKSKSYGETGDRYGPYPRFWIEKNRIREFETTSDIHRCVWSWRRMVESALETASQLSREQYHEIRYESLVLNPIEEADKLLGFLEISEPQSRLVFHKAVARSHSDSIGKWRRELSDDQLQQIYAEAGELLKRLGYT